MRRGDKGVANGANKFADELKKNEAEHVFGSLATTDKGKTGWGRGEGLGSVGLGKVIIRGDFWRLVRKKYWPD